MFSFSSTILLVCMRARHKVRDAYLPEEGIKPFIFSSPIRLHSNDFPIKLAFHKTLKLSETLEYF
jgi:hypothetical protein